MNTLNTKQMFLIQGGDCSTQLGEAVGLFAAGVLIASTGGLGAIAVGVIVSQAGWWRGMFAPCF